MRTVLCRRLVAVAVADQVNDHDHVNAHGTGPLLVKTPLTYWGPGGVGAIDPKGALARTHHMPRRTRSAAPEPCPDALMAAYVAGDDSALEALFNRLAARVLAFLRHGPDPSLAEELLQATFVQVHRARRRYRAGMCARLWIFSIAASLHRTAMDVRAPAESGSLAPESREGQRAVQAALAGLCWSQRLIFHLHRVERMSFAEIAYVMDTPEAEVRARALRVYRRLLETLSPLIDAGGGS